MRRDLVITHIFTCFPGYGAPMPIVQAPNMSVGVNLLFSMLGKVAKSLGEDYDVEISETHQKDAPKRYGVGTAEGFVRRARAAGRFGYAAVIMT